MSNIIQNNVLIVLKLESVDIDLVMLHHINQICGAVRAKEPKTISLNGFEHLAMVVRFKAPNVLFGHIAEIDTPSSTDYDKLNNAKEYIRLAGSDNNKNSSEEFF